jgi:hypothetical protein
MAWQLEHTDTFGGEANYCWVRRESLADSGDKPLTRRQIVRAAKAFAGFTGMRCEVESYGDMYRITPRGICQTVFAQWDDSP